MCPGASRFLFLGRGLDKQKTFVYIYNRSTNHTQTRTGTDMSADKEDFDALIATVKSFDGMLSDIDAHEIVYWYCVEYAEGQRCDLYALKRFCEYRPGPYTKNPHPDSYERVLVGALAEHVRGYAIPGVGNL